MTLGPRAFLLVGCGGERFTGFILSDLRAASKGIFQLVDLFFSHHR